MMNQLPSNLNDLVMTFLQIRDRWSFGMNFLHVRGGGGGGGGGGGATGGKDTCMLWKPV